jgi:sorting nexin-8
VINHPVIKDDGVLASFLTESSFEAWRKHTAVSLEEESSSKRVDRVEEMSIPSDLEDKLSTIRGRVNVQIELWQRICILAERLIKRQEAAAVRIPPALRRSYLPTHFALPLFSSPAHSSPLSSNSPVSVSDSASTIGGNSIASSVIGHAPHPNVAIGSVQSDLSRLTNTLRAVAEVTEQPWRSVVDELGQGVRQGLESVAAHTQRQSELSELRSRMLLDTTLESLKSQRDLHIAMRDLFVRHEHLSKDSVERLKKRVETSSARLETIKKAQKDNWQEEVDKVLSSIEKDQATIASQLNRRVFIRACLWHELRVVLHNRENTLLTLAVQTFAQEEQEYTESVMNTWGSLVEALENMPVE